MINRVSHLKATHYFSVASQTLSYTKAAEQLNVTQAAVSQQIRLLEEYLGVPLFYRRGREMHLTSQGQHLAEHLTQAFSYIQKGLESVKLEPLEGTLQVSGLQSFSSLWLMPKLWRFSDLYQNVNVKLSTSDEEDDVHAGNIDVSIDCQSHHEADVQQSLLLSSEIIPVCSPELANRIAFKQPSDLLGCWMIQVDHSIYSWETWFKEQNISPIRQKGIVWAEVSAWYMGINAVKAGHGIFLCPEFMVRKELENGSLVQAYPKSLNTQIHFYAHYAKESPRRMRIEAFVAWMQDEAKQALEDENTSAIHHQSLPWP